MKGDAPHIDDRALAVFRYLDGEMADQERAAFARELQASPDMARDVESWQSLFEALGDLPSHAPSFGFRPRVMARMRMRPSWAARIRAIIDGTPATIPANPLAAYADGSLTRRERRQVAAFLATNGEAQAAVTQWRRMFRRLSETPELAPSEGFANRVMARVPTQQPAVAPSRVRSLAARVATLLPRRRERLAAVSGVAVGPTAVLGALAYMVFSNPLTTPSTVLSYVWAKAMAALSLTTQALLGGALESAALRTAYGFFEVFTGSGALVAGSLIAFAGMTMVAGWVLYRYLIKIPSMDQRYASI